MSGPKQEQLQRKWGAYRSLIWGENERQHVSCWLSGPVMEQFVLMIRAGVESEITPKVKAMPRVNPESRARPRISAKITVNSTPRIKLELQLGVTPRVSPWN